MSELNIIDIKEIKNAHERVKKYIHRTPVMVSHSLNELVGHEVFFKCEHLQKTGSFKIRGALNAAFQAPADTKGFIGFSSGNHAQALAVAARMLGKKAILIMPEDTSELKINNTKAYGAEVFTEGVTIENRYEILDQMAAETGYHVIVPFDDEKIMAGQGTIMLEFLEQAPEIQAVIAPIGGGGLMGGVSSATKQLRPDVEVIGVEPDVADDARQSLEKGERVRLSETPETVCDGIRTIILGEKTFPVIKRNVDRILTAPDEKTLAAQELIMQRLKQLIEPTSAIALAPLLMDYKLPKKVGVIISGGNWMPH